MPDTNIETIQRRTPAIIKDDKGRERIENGRWSLLAAAQWVASHPEKMFKASDLCRVANERVAKQSTERRRRELSKIADIMLEELQIPAVLEWSGRKITAVGRYNPQEEYHQRLMAEEINRRNIKADGSARRLENLIGLLPRGSQ